MVLWLGDVGSDGHAAVEPWAQTLADDFHVAVVGIGGDQRFGLHATRWSGEAAADRARVEEALAGLEGVEIDQLYVAGLGQGAKLGVELTLRDAQWFDALLALRPTTTWDGERDARAEGVRDRDQVVRLVADALEVDDNHAMMRRDRGRFMRTGTEVSLEVEDSVWPAGRPPGLEGRLRDWLGALLYPEGLPPELQPAPEPEPEPEPEAAEEVTTEEATASEEAVPEPAPAEAAPVEEAPEAGAEAPEAAPADEVDEVDAGEPAAEAP